jgi:hypothetical protein
MPWTFLPVEENLYNHTDDQAPRTAEVLHERLNGANRP